jgi:hypothetical protein
MRRRSEGAEVRQIGELQEHGGGNFNLLLNLEDVKQRRLQIAKKGAKKKQKVEVDNSDLDSYDDKHLFCSDLLQDLELETCNDVCWVVPSEVYSLWSDAPLKNKIKVLEGVVLEGGQLSTFVYDKKRPASLIGHMVSGMPAYEMQLEHSMDELQAMLCNSMQRAKKVCMANLHAPLPVLAALLQPTGLPRFELLEAKAAVRIILSTAAELESFLGLEPGTKLTTTYHLGSYSELEPPLRMTWWPAHNILLCVGRIKTYNDIGVEQAAQVLPQVQATLIPGAGAAAGPGPQTVHVAVQDQDAVAIDVEWNVDLMDEAEQMAVDAMVSSIRREDEARGGG